MLKKLVKILPLLKCAVVQRSQYIYFQKNEDLKCQYRLNINRFILHHCQLILFCLINHDEYFYNENLKIR